jgi:Fe-S cluster assembly protein SufB
MTAPEAPRSASMRDSAGTVLIAGPREDLVRQLSAQRSEPDWMLRLRLRGLDSLHSEGVPSWASFLRGVDYAGMVSAVEPATGAPGEPHGDATSSPGLASLDASEEAYRALREDLRHLAVRFDGLPSALASDPDLVRSHFASVIPADANPLAALNAALWSDGSFLYVPPGVAVPVPLQAEIRADYTGVEPFERNVLIADRGSDVTYIEGCTAPVYTPDRLHVSAIEVVALPGAHVRYIALQNFSKEVDNLVTKRASVHAGASVEWIDINLGARRLWKIPRADLLGAEASADFVGVALSGKGQSTDVGAEMVHLAPRTRSRIVNHAIVHGGGGAVLESGVRVAAGATDATSSIEWSSLMLDSESRARTVPAIEVDEADAQISQSGSVRKVGEEMLFYMSSRGVSAEEAVRMVVLGIADVATRRIPVEYAVEVDRLIEFELGGAVG